jgi:hypothetical protein
MVEGGASTAAASKYNRTLKHIYNYEIPHPDDSLKEAAGKLSNFSLNHSQGDLNK